MKNRKGFTLVEVLAVLIVLSLISVIVYPRVNNILENNKKKAFTEKVKSTIRSYNSYLASENYPDLGVIDITKSTISTIDSSVWKTGTITNINNKSYIENFYDGEYCAYGYEKSLKVYKGKCKTLYVENVLNGADPVLDDGMIPVTIDNDGTVKKADIYSEWYKYDDNDNSKWANAILVTDTSRDNYKKANANITINQSDILAYLVWIPRYSYAIPTVNDKNNPPLINIIFENKGTSKKNGDATGENYYTHPGFTFDDKELNGIWVGKFETTVDPNSICGTDPSDDNCKNVVPTILPNISSLRYQNVSTQFETAKKFKDYQISGNPHIIKNSEWGAVAYLSHSKYGNKSNIRINNNDSYKTGCGASTNAASETPECQIEYGGFIQYPQSTTDNITGIFDMAGSALDRVMGNYNNFISNSGFTKLPDLKYYDLYSTDNYLTACNGSCTGHCNYEVNLWYGNPNYTLDEFGPWLNRGSNYDETTEAGAFTSGGNDGNGYDYVTFRLSITN